MSCALVRNRRLPWAVRILIALLIDIVSIPWT